MNSTITGDRKYISALEAGRLAGVSRDYIARLCRQKVLRGKRIGKFWIVDENSLKNYAYAAVRAKIERREHLIKARTAEYSAKRGSGGVIKTPRGGEKPELDNKILSLDTWRVQKHTGDALDFLHAQTKAPVTFSAAAHMIPPSTAHHLGDVLYKIISLVTIFIIVFGSYAMFDRRYAEFAGDTLHDTRNSIVAMSKMFAHGFDVDIATSRTQQLASVIATDIGDFSAEKFVGALSAVARTVHDRVDATSVSVFDDISEEKPGVEIETTPLNVSD